MSTRSTPSRARRGGFTLVELLVVIAILVLLASILVPTLSAVIQSGYASQTQSRIMSLGNATDLFAREHNNRYPGQDGQGISDQTTGSQLLARALFTPTEPGLEFPHGVYIEYRPGLLTADNALADGFPEPMEIAYYPSRRMHAGQTGSGGIYQQFRWQDNSVYTGRDQARFSRFLAMPDASNPDNADTISQANTRVNNTVPPNDGRFLLIAPGRDREYFTARDVRNF